MLHNMEYWDGNLCNSGETYRGGVVRAIQIYLEKYNLYTKDKIIKMQKTKYLKN